MKKASSWYFIRPEAVYHVSRVRLSRQTSFEIMSFGKTDSSRFLFCPWRLLTLDKYLNISVLQFSHLQNGNICSMAVGGLMSEHGRDERQCCLAHRKYSALDLWYCDLQLEIYTVFIPILGTELPQNVLSNKSHKLCFETCNKPFQPHLSLCPCGDFGKVPKDGGWLPGNQSFDWNVGNFSSTPNLWERERSWRLSITDGQWFDLSCLWNEASIKTQRGRVQRASWFVNTMEIGESGVLREQRHSGPFLHTLSCVSLPFGCSWVISFNTNQWSCE